MNAVCEQSSKDNYQSIMKIIAPIYRRLIDHRQICNNPRSYNDIHQIGFKRYSPKKSEDVPEKLMEYMKKLVNTGINELCIGDKMFVDSDSSSSDDDSPCWY